MGLHLASWFTKRSTLWWRSRSGRLLAHGITEAASWSRTRSGLKVSCPKRGLLVDVTRRPVASLAGRFQQSRQLPETRFDRSYGAARDFCEAGPAGQVDGTPAWSWAALRKRSGSRSRSAAHGSCAGGQSLTAASSSSAVASIERLAIFTACVTASSNACSIVGSPMTISPASPAISSCAAS